MIGKPSEKNKFTIKNLKLKIQLKIYLCFDMNVQLQNHSYILK